MLIGAIEAGGTKFVCSVGSGPQDLRPEIRFPTTTPAETLDKAIAYFHERQAEEGALAAIGVASFGPVDPDPNSPSYGFITTTPKPGWANADVVGALQAEFDLPIGFDTDVNGAALSEGQWGAAQGLDTFIYLTIGTGIGGGRDGQRQAAAWPRAPGNGAYAPGPRLAARSLPRLLPLSWGLPGGDGRRPGDRKALGDARAGVRGGSPGLGFGS